ncbi:MAG: phage portal protein [Lachnospiraceae bacterium]|nr:phage portal protein [Lachnospiraceae bacterium]
MDIFSFFQKRGIDTVNASFYRKIEEWKSWYNGNVRNFSWYKVYSGHGTYSRHKRKTLGMAKKLSEDIADLMLNERVGVSLADQMTNDFVHKVLEENHFLVIGNDYQERKAYTGTVAYIPYLDKTDVDTTGMIHSGRIRINYVSAGNIFPISWSNGVIHEVAFTFEKTVRRRKYIQVQFHTLQNGLYVIENMVLQNVAGSKDGIELTPQQWKQLKPFRYVEPRIETGSANPLFAIDRLNIVNNADDDETNPMGVAIFANAIDILKKLDIEYDSYANEYDLGRKRIFVAPELLKNSDGSPAFDPEDTVFYKLPEDYSGEDGEGKMIQEINMEIRADAHEKGINDDLNYLSLKCGFGTERYRFEKGSVKTATEVISVNSDLYRILKKHEIILEDALKQLIGIIINLGCVLNYPLDPETEITIDFDDSIIEDKQAERNTDRQDVAMGAMNLWEYRKKWYNETEEQARAAVSQPVEVIE